MRDTQGRERGRDTGRGRSKLHAGSLMRDSIPGIDPRTPESSPEPMAGAKPLSHPKILFILERLLREWQKHRPREKQAPCGEPDVGLNPRTPGSRPEPKADAKPLSQPGI